MDDRYPSHEALAVFGYLNCRGGSMRLIPMLRHFRMEPRTFIDAINDLNERCWLRIVWHRAPPDTPPDEPRPLTEVYRLCTTRFGRLKYRRTWQAR